VLDERTGMGGGIDAMDWLSGELSTPGDMFAMDFLPAMESDALASDRSAIVACSASASELTNTNCGNGFRWNFGQTASTHFGEAKDSKLAVLIATDVSGNDYVTKILHHRSAQTRLFGHGSTEGAYGIIWHMPELVGELWGGSLQVQDTIFMTSPTDVNTTFPTSTGERPDEDVLRLQSDCVQGKDTVIAAAKAWLAAP
jgi:hypothetical protein